MKRIFAILKKKSGASTIEFAISLLLFVTLFVGGYEFFMMGHKYLTVNSFANNLARVISVQGGVSVNTPKGFQGINTANNNYRNSANIARSIDNLAESIGQKKEDVDVYIAYQDNDSSNTTKKITPSLEIEIPYNTKFEIIVKYKFRMMLLHYETKIFDTLYVTKRKADISNFEHDYEIYNDYEDDDGDFRD